MLKSLARYKWIIKLLISAALLTWLLRKTDLSAIWGSISGAHPGWVAFALGMNLTGMLVSSLRWKVLLSSKGSRIPLWRLYLSYLVAMFFNNFLPSTIGGDAMRAYDSWKHGGDKSGAVAVVLVDRALGLSALLIVAAVCALAMYGTATLYRAATEVLPAPALIGAAASAVVALLAVIFSSGLRARLVRLIERLPLAEKVLSLLRSVWDFRRFPGHLALALTLSFVLQSMVIAYYFIIGRALGLDVPLIYFGMVIPLILIIMMLPISINGIGVRESAFAFFLGAYGVAQADAIALAWVAYALVLLQGLVGGLIYAVRR